MVYTTEDLTYLFLVLSNCVLFVWLYDVVYSAIVTHMFRPRNLVSDDDKCCAECETSEPTTPNPGGNDLVGHDCLMQSGICEWSGYNKENTPPKVFIKQTVVDESDLVPSSPPNAPLPPVPTTDPTPILFSPNKVKGIAKYQKIIDAPYEEPYETAELVR